MNAVDPETGTQGWPSNETSSIVAMVCCDNRPRMIKPETPTEAGDEGSQKVYAVETY